MKEGSGNSVVAMQMATGMKRCLLVNTTGLDDQYENAENYCTIISKTSKTDRVQHPPNNQDAEYAITIYNINDDKIDVGEMKFIIAHATEHKHNAIVFDWKHNSTNAIIMQSTHIVSLFTRSLISEYPKGAYSSVLREYVDKLEQKYNDANVVSARGLKIMGLFIKLENDVVDAELENMTKMFLDESKIVIQQFYMCVHEKLYTLRKQGEFVPGITSDVMPMKPAVLLIHHLRTTPTIETELQFTALKN